MNLWLVKAAVAALCSPMWSVRARRVAGRRLSSWPASWTVAAFALSRIVPCLLAMVAFRLRYPEDAVEWSRIATGHLSTPYDAGFNAILASLWWIAPSPLTFVAVMITAEVVAFALFVHIVRAAALQATGNAVLVFWFVNPLSLFHIALNGQDEVLILLTWCVVLWAVLRRDAPLAGLVGAVGMFFTKVVAPVALLPIAALPEREIRIGISVFVGLMAAATIALVLARVPVFAFIGELNFLTSGNIWALPGILGLAYTHSPAAECGIAAAAMGLALLRLRQRPLTSVFEQSLRITGVVGAVFMALSPKSPTAWLVMFLPGTLFLIATTTQWRQAFLLFIFLPATAFEPSFWFSFDQGVLLGQLWWSRPAMVVLDAILLGGYLMLIGRGLGLRDADMPIGESVRV